MPYLVDVRTMQAVEKEADQKGVSLERMMEMAGSAAAKILLRHLENHHEAEVVIVGGPGNNGGDGIVAALNLHKAGCSVHVFLTEPKKVIPRLLEQLDAYGIETVDLKSRDGLIQLKAALQNADAVIDSLLGTGTRLPLRSPIPSILTIIRNACRDAGTGRPFLLAIDCPSGIDCDTGNAAPETLAADVTITFGALKQGLIRFPAAEFTGSIRVADIGLPNDMEAYRGLHTEVATHQQMRGWLVPRPKDAHKGTFGRVIIVGGSINYPGAILLATQAAYRSGAGLVTAAVPPDVYRAGASWIPEATWILLPEENGVIAAGAEDILLTEESSVDAVVLGPGIGLQRSTAAFLRKYLAGEGSRRTRIGFGKDSSGLTAEESSRPRPRFVIDADALKLIAAWPEAWTHLPAGSVITPHPGEMAVLTNLSKEQIQKDRTGIAARFAKEWNTHVVLKGAFTVIASPEGQEFIIPFSTPALSRAGTGDILAGIIGGLMAQGMASLQAAVLGAYLHGRAGELTISRLGDAAAVLARDVEEEISLAITELRLQPGD